MEAVSRRNAWAEELRSIANAGSQTVGLRRQTVSSYDRSPCPLAVHVRLGLGGPWQSRKVIRRPATQYSKITLKRVVTIHQADHLAKKNGWRTRLLDRAVFVKDTDATVSLVATFQ